MGQPGGQWPGRHWGGGLQFSPALRPALGGLAGMAVEGVGEIPWGSSSLTGWGVLRDPLAEQGAGPGADGAMLAG